MTRNSISIKKIAELAGTSVATVSRVINHNGRYSKETEEKVLQIMKEYNYQPNVLAKALRENKTNLIGVILPDITHMFFAKVYRAIELELYAQGYLPVLCDTNEDEELESKYIENISSLRFAGLICLNGTRHTLPDDLPTLYVDRYPGSEEVDTVNFIGCNNFQGGYLATEALIKAGKKRIGMVLHDKLITTQQQRYLGFVKALNDYQLPLYPELVFSVDKVDVDKGIEITDTIIKSGIGCDGVFYSSDILAYGGLKYLQEHHVNMPEEIAIVGFDDVPISTLAGLSTIKQQTSYMGELAAKTIIDMIDGKEVEKNQILDVKLVKRKTL